MSRDSESQLEMALVAVKPGKPMPISSVQPSNQMHGPLATVTPKLRPFVRRGPKVKIIAYVLQCDDCRKWRKCPSQDLYETIRASGKRWICEDALEWAENVSCADPGHYEENTQDIIWANDSHCLPKTPKDWKRELVIRGQGSTKFGDIYYTSPCGKKLRSMVEVSKFLDEHPEYEEGGLKISDFCYRTPQPADKNYVRKKRSHGTKVVTSNKKAALMIKPINSSVVPAVPAGWTRELEVRCSKNSKFCNISYIAPCGRKVGSVSELEKFLQDNEQYVSLGVAVEQFSFVAPDSDVGIVEAASEPGCRLNTGMTGSLPRLTM